MPLIQDLNVDQLKVPLGFIKIPELILAVIAYTARSGWTFDISYKCSNGDKKAYSFTDFTINDLFEKCGDSSSDRVLDIDHSSAARFFGLVAIASILFVLVALYVYLFKWGVYAGDERVPKIDLVITSVLAIGWFLATWIWWGATNTLEDETDPKIIANRFKPTDMCDRKKVDWDKCEFTSYADYATLTVSVIAGFGCLLLFATNMWFAYKETAWFRERKGGAPSATATATQGSFA